MSFLAVSLSMFGGLPFLCLVSFLVCFPGYVWWAFLSMFDALSMIGWLSCCVSVYVSSWIRQLWNGGGGGGKKAHAPVSFLAVSV